MHKRILMIIIAVLFAVTGFAQETDDKEKKDDSEVKSNIGNKAYAEIVLEDFEETTYEKKNIKIDGHRNATGGVMIQPREGKKGYPAPTTSSKGRSTKYLGIKVKGKKGDNFTIYPAKDLIIDRFCNEITIWVYGKKFSGELSIFLQDAKKKVKRIRFPDLNFLGWRKLSVKLGKDIAQQDDNLNKPQSMKIIYLQYRPYRRGNQPVWQYFYIDDISAKVRDKYTDRMSDDW